MNTSYYEVDLKQLFLYILKKYKQIIICIFIGVFLGCCFSYVEMKKNTSESALETIEKARNQIDVNEVKQYSNAVGLYRSMIEYENNSKLMNLNANNVYKGVLSYGITSKENNINELGEHFKSTLDRAGRWDKLQRNLSEEYSINNLKELINLKCNINNNNNYNNNAIVISSSNDFCILDVIVYGEDRSFVEDVLKFVSEEIENTKSEIDNNSSFSMYKNKESITNGFCSEILDLQKQEFDTKQLVLNNVVTLKGKLNKEEELYYNYYYNYDEYFSRAKNNFSINKPVNIGLLFGILTVSLYFVLFVFEGRVRVENDIKNRYNVPLLGVVNANSKSIRGIERFFKSLEGIEYNTKDYINRIIKSLDKKKLAVSSDYKELNELLENDINVIGVLNKDSKALEEVKNYEDIVIVAKIDDTKLEDIRRQVEIAKNLNKNIVGFISIRQ